MCNGRRSKRPLPLVVMMLLLKLLVLEELLSSCEPSGNHIERLHFLAQCIVGVVEENVDLLAVVFFDFGQELEEAAGHLHEADGGVVGVDEAFGLFWLGRGRDGVSVVVVVCLLLLLLLFFLLLLLLALFGCGGWRGPTSSSTCRRKRR